MNRSLLMMIFVTAFGSVFAQNRGNIGQPGAGAAAPIFDSLGISIPQGELVHGTGTKAPGSSDSLTWNAGLFVTGPVRFDALTADALDSLAYFDAQGDVGKVHVDDLGISGGDSLGVSVDIAQIIYGTNSKLPGYRNGFQIKDIGGTEQLFLESVGQPELLLRVSALSGSDGHPNVTLTNEHGWSAVMQQTPGISTASSFNLISSGAINLKRSSTTLLSALTTNQIQIPGYDAGAFDATPAKALGLDASENIVTYTVSGADSMGLTMPTGYLLMGRGDALPDTLAGLFANTTGLGIGTASPTEKLTVIGQVLAYGANIVRTGASASVLFNRTDGAAATFGGGNAQSVFLYDENYPLEFRSTSRANTEAKILNSGTLRINVAGNGSVGIGGVANASAKLDVSSTTQGLLLPRMTSTQRDAISSPAAGLIIYNTTTSRVEVYNGSWTALH